MGERFSAGKRALGVCDVCGFTFKLKTLRTIVRRGQPTGLKACRECWDPDHPQNMLGTFEVNDPQALRDPRPDTNQLSASRSQVVTSPSLNMSVLVGEGTVTI